GIAEPCAADADAADETDRMVDHEQLAMIAREPAERARQPWRAVGAHLAARGAQRGPQARPRLAEAAEPVAHDAYAHARGRAFGECRDEFAAERVVAENVILEQDRPLGAADRREPGIECRARVDEQVDAVAGEQGRA